MSKDNDNTRSRPARGGALAQWRDRASSPDRGRSERSPDAGARAQQADRGRAGPSSPDRSRSPSQDRGRSDYQDRGRSGYSSQDRGRSSPQDGGRSGYQDRGRSDYSSQDRGRSSPQDGGRSGYQDRGRSDYSSQDRGRSSSQDGGRSGYQDRGRSDYASQDRGRSSSQDGGRSGYQDRGRSDYASQDRGRSDYGDRGRADYGSQGSGRSYSDRGGNRPQDGGRGRGPNPGFGGPGAGAPRPRMPIAAVRLEQVQRVLSEVLQWTYPADGVLSHWFRAHPNLGGRDRAEVAEAVYDVLRNLRRYRQLSESGVGNATRRLAILGLAGFRGSEWVQEGLDSGESAWLARVDLIDPATLPRPVRLSMPDWLDERFAVMPEGEALMASLNVAANLDIRVNPLKGDRDALLATLNAGPLARFAPQPTAHSPWGIRFKGHPPINRLPEFENGTLEVQDEGSQLLALLVGPRRGEMIIDFCAGAGGKSLLIGALMRSTGRLYAFDVSAARLARAKPRFARSGLSNVVPVAIESENDARVKRLAGKAQRVFVDAPCTGIGTLRRNPDLKWRQQPQVLAELVDLQYRILKSAARCVAPGGRLVYATCSLLEEENAAQAERFLAEHPEFERLDAARILQDRCPTLALTGPYVQLRPDEHGTDGFFGAVFERKKAARSTAATEASTDAPAVGAGSALPASNEEAAERKPRGAESDVVEGVADTGTDTGAGASDGGSDGGGGTD
nr:RsmB/NOP family class I SAM-dependent RNA methyltransferase [Bordetella genomosp. 5]